MNSLKTNAWFMFYLAFIAWVVSWMQVSALAVFAQRISYKTRIIYFTKCLEKDSAFYDINNPNEMSAKISKEIMAIQRGTGEKIGNIAMSVSSFFFGFALAFYWGWLYTVLLLGVVPFLGITGIAMGVSLEGGVTK